MSIKLRCPHCFLKIGADEEHKGSKVNCPGCERVIHIHCKDIRKDILDKSLKNDNGILYGNNILEIENYLSSSNF